MTTYTYKQHRYEDGRLTHNEKKQIIPRAIFLLTYAASTPAEVEEIYRQTKILTEQSYGGNRWRLENWASHFAHFHMDRNKPVPFHIDEEYLSAYRNYTNKPRHFN